MGNYKTSTLLLTALLTGISITAQEVAKPVAKIVGKESEATSVLGGGWPPQNFGTKPGNQVVKKINPALITPSPSKEAILPAPQKIVDSSGKLLADLVPKTPSEASAKPAPVQITQASSKSSSPDTTAKTPTPKSPVAAPESKKDIKKPSFVLPVLPVEKKAEPQTVTKQATSPLLNKAAPGSSLLPPLPEIEDFITPAVKANIARAPQPERKRVLSHYTLGAGDAVTFSSYDREDLTRTVKIAPDGTVSYLQAVAINASGLTVDELRDRMEAELQKYRRDFKLIISPEELGSKGFSILGRVREPGTFPLNRPTTVLEGIALARGVEVGTIRGSAFGLADFCRSFVSRNGRKLDVDFSKLYHEGDLSQNACLLPNDYIYIASVLKNEFFILGAVNSPGRVKMPNRITVTKAIAMSGGFQNEAYRMKVLVIRGDIENPNVEIVNVRDVLNGSGLDIEVEPGDIIFVSRRPFEILERVLDTAITTYVQTVTSEAINLQYAN